MEHVKKISSLTEASPKGRGRGVVYDKFFVCDVLPKGGRQKKYSTF